MSDNMAPKPDNLAPQPEALSVEAWYRQFWPWFLIALPASVVVASFFMLYLAIKHADTLVSDNYYRDGLAINQVLFQDARARELGLSAQMTFDLSEGVLAINVSGDFSNNQNLPDVLTLQLLHPTDADADRTIRVLAGGEGRYRGKLPVIPEHRFYLRLMPGTIAEQNDIKLAEWRLNGELDFATVNHVLLSADQNVP